MSRRLIPLLVTLLVVVMAMPAAAITFGTPDDPPIPAIRTSVPSSPMIRPLAATSSGAVARWWPRFALTAAHCLVGIGEPRPLSVSASMPSGAATGRARLSARSSPWPRTASTPTPGIPDRDRIRSIWPLST